MDKTVSYLVKSIFMLAALGLGAADLSPSRTAHIRVGAVIQRFIAFSGGSFLRLRASDPGSTELQASTELNLGTAHDGCTLSLPSSIRLQGPSGSATEVQIMQAPGASPAAARLHARLDVPAGLPSGSYTGVVDVVLVYN